MSLRKKYHLLRQDFRGIAFMMLGRLRSGTTKRTATVYTYLLCRLKDIRLGRHIGFYGIPVLDRKPFSTILLGSRCRIRSDRTTNLARKKRCIIRTLNKGAYVEIQENTGINGSVIAAAEKIVIGRDVLIGYNCYITDTDSHPLDPARRHLDEAETAPVTIGDNVWLGANVVVLKGVTIGENSVIGANSLVLSSVPANVFAIGNPCRVIKKI